MNKKRVGGGIERTFFWFGNARENVSHRPSTRCLSSQEM